MKYKGYLRSIKVIAVTVCPGSLRAQVLRGSMRTCQVTLQRFLQTLPHVLAPTAGSTYTSLSWSTCINSRAVTTQGSMFLHLPSESHLCNTVGYFWSMETSPANPMHNDSFPSSSIRSPTESSLQGKQNPLQGTASHGWSTGRPGTQSCCFQTCRRNTSVSFLLQKEIIAPNFASASTRPQGNFSEPHSSPLLWGVQSLLLSIFRIQRSWTSFITLLFDELRYGGPWK